MVAGLGGVVVGDVLGARRTREQWRREVGEHNRRELLDCYEQVLQTVSMTQLALSLQRLVREHGPLPSYPGAPGIESPQEFALLVNRAALLGAPDDALTLMRGLLKAIAKAMRLVVADELDIGELEATTKDISTMSTGLHACLRDDLASRRT